MTTPSSSAFEPTHTYTDTGLYVVTMILTDSNACVPPDTAHITVHVATTAGAHRQHRPVCTGVAVQLHAHGGYAFAWYPAAGLSDTTIADPMVTADTTSTFHVFVTDSCGVDTASIEVVFGVPSGYAGPDTLTMRRARCAHSSAAAAPPTSGAPRALLDDPHAQSPHRDTRRHHALPGGHHLGRGLREHGLARGERGARPPAPFTCRYRRVPR